MFTKSQKYLSLKLLIEMSLLAFPQKAIPKFLFRFLTLIEVLYPQNKLLYGTCMVRVY